MGENFDKSKLDDVAQMIQRYEHLSDMAYILAVPPLEPNGEWHSIGNSLLRSVGIGEIHPIVAEYAVIGDAYRANDRTLFNQHVQLMTDWFAKEQPNTSKRASFEFLFNRLQPFSQSMTLYVLAFLLACASWLGCEQCSQAFGFLHFTARACHSHLRSVFADVSARASTGHQSVFISNFHWLGRSHCRADTRTNFQRRHRRGVRGRNWFCDLNHRASSRRQRRHARNVAGCARYQHLARHSRRRDHHRLLRHVSRRYACHHLRRARRLHDAR